MLMVLLVIVAVALFWGAFAVLCALAPRVPMVVVWLCLASTLLILFSAYCQVKGY